MVLLKILGIIDLGMAITLLMAALGVPPGRFYFFFMILHALKAAFFFRNFLSIIDLLIVLYTLIAPFWTNIYLTIFIVGFLVYKGVYSLV